MKVAASIQNDLSQVGIKVNIIPEASGTFMANNEKGNVTPFFQYAWYQDFPDASDFLNTLFNTNEQPQNNSTMYSNQQVDARLNEAQTDTNQTQRNQLYAQVTDKVMSDADWVPMYYGVTQYAVQPWVHGFYINPTLPDQLQLLWLDPSHR